MIPALAFAAGAAAAVAGRAALQRALLAKLRRDVRALNGGDAGPLLAGIADDAVLHFNGGDHRWAGDHRGKAAIARFLDEFVGAGIQGEILRLWIGGPPWSPTLAVRFDDHADGPDGERIYENRTVIVARTRWGRIVEQRDFYEDTGRILAFDAALRRRDAAPAALK